MTQPKLKSEPWYTQKKKYVELADRYVKGMRTTLKQDDPLAVAELGSYYQYSLIKLIYESNRIESAGLSEGETKKLIGQLPELKPQPQMHLSTMPCPELHAAIAAGKLKPAIRFEGVSRPEQEVLQHWDAAFPVMNIVTAYWNALAAGVAAPVLIGEVLIKELHATLAAGLLPANCGVVAGQYRVDDRQIDGVDLKLPTPALLPAMMVKFVQDSQARLHSNKSACEVAAWISYEFACIHPFPDFNGRISRLLLAMVLQAKGLPVWITVRGDAKNKKRYLLALRHANRGNLDSYTTLIAMAMVHAGEQIDANLKRAGLPGLLEPGA